jgi:hypothetical protein
MESIIDENNNNNTRIIDTESHSMFVSVNICATIGGRISFLILSLVRDIAGGEGLASPPPFCAAREVHDLSSQLPSHLLLISPSSFLISHLSFLNSFSSSLFSSPSLFLISSLFSSLLISFSHLRGFHSSVYLVLAVHCLVGACL